MEPTTKQLGLYTYSHEQDTVDDMGMGKVGVFFGPSGRFPLVEASDERKLFSRFAARVWETIHDK